MIADRCEQALQMSFALEVELANCMMRTGSQFVKTMQDHLERRQRNVRLLRTIQRVPRLGFVCNLGGTHRTA